MNSDESGNGTVGENGEVDTTDGVSAPVSTKKKRSHTKNWVGQNDGTPFPLNTAAEVASFVTAFGRMGENWDGGYETHFNNDGPLCRKGVERIANTGKGKVIAVFADALAEDAALVGVSDYDADLPKRRNPVEAERILTAVYEYIGGLIETKREQIAERNLVEAAKAAGVSVDDLRNLRSKQMA